MYRNLAIVLISLYVSYTSQQTGKVCPISIQTLKPVTSCPSTEEEWEKAAKSKYCSLIRQNCTSPENFQYHCLVNKFKNATLEVCAEILKINGYCPFFDEKLQRIDVITERDCANVSSRRCPRQYNSTELVKYPICFELESAYFPSTGKIQDETNTGRYKDNEKKDSEETVLWKILLAILGFCILLLIIVILVYRRFKGCQDSNEQVADDGKESETNDILMKKGVEKNSDKMENHEEENALLQKGVEKDADKMEKHEEEDALLEKGLEQKTTEEENGKRRKKLMEKDENNYFQLVRHRTRKKDIFATVNLGATHTKFGFAEVEYGSSEMSKFCIFIEPSVLLLDSNGDFDSFGNAALEKFLKLEYPDSENVDFFRNFMNISTIHDMKTYDEKFMSTQKGKNKKMSNILAITMSHIKERILEDVAFKYPDQDILWWILTVPGTWNENAKNLFHKAVKQASFKNYSFCNEHEAALKWFLLNHNEPLSVDEKDQLFIDLGGATTKIYAANNGKKIASNTVQDSGGILLVKGLTKCMQNLFSPIVYEAYKVKYREESAELSQAFLEAMLRHKLESSESEKFCIEKLIGLFKNLNENECTATPKSKSPGISLQGSNFEILHEGVLHLFEPLKKKIREGVEKFLSTMPTDTNIAVYVFGGLSESEILFECVKKFLDKKSITHIQKIGKPEEAIIKGALLKCKEDKEY